MTVIEILEYAGKALVILACCAMLLILASYMFFLVFILIRSFICSWIIDPIRDFLKKRKAPKEPAPPSVPCPCDKFKKLEVGYKLLKDDFDRVQQKRDAEAFNLCEELSETRKRLENQDGEIDQIVKSEFDNIILSLPKSKIFAPNVSIEHLTSLCNVPEANERFFRALLQEFEIEHLEVNNVDGKHNITMKLRSGNKTYTTQLDDCTCRDFYKVNGQKVCKHMYFLALTLGLISREHFEQFHECAKSFPEKKLKSLMKKK